VTKQTETKQTNNQILGIHHITAIAGDPQTNLDFYAGVLGLRLVKLTVNFEDPGTYHLYYGNAVGHPGTILTFFPWPSRRAVAERDR
jgi:glyoxalase family protein